MQRCSTKKSESSVFVIWDTLVKIRTLVRYSTYLSIEALGAREYKKTIA